MKEISRVWTINVKTKTIYNCLKKSVLINIPTERKNMKIYRFMNVLKKSCFQYLFQIVHSWTISMTVRMT